MKEILREWKKFLLKENSQLVPYTDERLEKRKSRSTCIRRVMRTTA
jgi:hypothetical protein